MRSKNIDKLLHDKNTPKSDRRFFLRIKDIKKFAANQIGLNANGNYKNFININKSYLIDVVAASREDSFRSLNWSYPFVGKFPYIGFFDRMEAEEYARNLDTKGYDVIIRKVDAYSSLGIISDPIYSFMKNYSLYSISSLLIHELTHVTVFVKNDPQFNEEVATFVGIEGALYYIRYRYGEDSKIYHNSLAKIEDYKTYFRFMHKLYYELNKMYSLKISKEEKIRRKKQIFKKYKKKFIQEYDMMFYTRSYYSFKNVKLNNAYVKKYMVYTKDLSLLYDLYRDKNYNLRRTVGVVKSICMKSDNPKEYIRKKLKK